MPQRYFKGAIWTNHALKRLGERGLTQEIASLAFHKPDHTLQGRERDTKHYQKRVGRSLVTVIAKQNEKSEWVILSCWVDPPISGSEDDKKKRKYMAYQNSSFWGKAWIILKSQLGLSKY